MPRISAYYHDSAAALIIDGRPVAAARFERFTHPRFDQLLRTGERLSGCPVVINTSFNVRDEPKVFTPPDYLRCFLATNNDVLVMGHCVLRKNGQEAMSQSEVEPHVAQFQLD